ncbi:PepSY domain-containing protein [Caulobacter sp.]|uniref:PepSY-associated TM helix domain-containing protein n=1 Tax=Caulobacter sp. TaxID=78 RepID=UPI002B4A599D|nr:PepSY domain-containing protein [Caulobacter sp.]HJV40045.1 PepSY domain-containing protein [Caulobacter sp.]
MTPPRAKLDVRALARRVHLWLGLSLGVLLAVIGLTGSILVFYPQIDDALHPEISLVGSAPAPSWERAYRTVRTVYPDKAGSWRFEVTGRGGDIPARYYKPAERAGRDFAPMMVWLAADGGRVLRRDYWGEYAVTWIYDLHHRLLLQGTGGKILGYSGLAMLVLMLAGLAAWWPRPGSLGKALRFKPEAAPGRRLYDLHKLTGLSSLGFLLLLTITGVLLALPKESAQVLSPILGAPGQPPGAAAAERSFTPERRVSLDRAVAAAVNALPGTSVAWIETPSIDHGLYRIRMQAPGDPSARFPHSFFWIDPANGAVLAITDARRAGPHDMLLNWIHPLHDGSVGGLATRWIAFIAGLAPTFLLFLGVMRWRLRHRARRPATPITRRPRVLGRPQ